MSKKSNELPLSEESVTETLKFITDKLKSGENLDELIEYKKLFKKNTPFHLRSLTAAFLLKEYLKKSRRRMAGGTSIFVSIGKNRRVFPSDLIQLVNKTGKVSKESIGDIKILDSYSFINIKPSDAQTVIDNLNGIEYRGRKLTVNLAKKNS